MTKKFLLLTLCLFILGTFISACGGGGKSTPPSYPFIPVPTPTVSPTPEPTPAKYPIELSQTEFTVNVGETDNITVKLNGEDITQTATYTVDQEAIATVEGGLITGISVGIATVTVNAENAESEKTFTVNVIDPSLPTLEVSPTELNLGIEKEATVTVTLNGKDVTKEVTYTSDEESIATAEKGIVKTGTEEGTAKITVSLEGANSAVFTVNVKYQVALNDDVLDQLHELGIIAKGSADKTKLTEINIPAIFTYEGTKYKIISIEKEIFKECTLLKTVTIPNSVKSIGTGAFDSCSSLEEITIGNSVETIEDGAFTGCSSLKEIIIPDSVKSIGTAAFYNCTFLETLTIGNSVTTIGNSAFSGCSSLEEIVIPNSVKTIEGGAFSGCSSLKEIVIPDSVKTIEGGAFSACTSLEKVTIGNGLTEIADGLFFGLTNLTTVTIGNSVKTIEANAFSNCSSLKEIVISDSVETIGDGAFYNVAEITYTSEMKATGSPWGANKVNGVVQME